MTPDMLENITFEELEIGQSAELKRTLTQKDIELFAAEPDITNPIAMNWDEKGRYSQE